MIWFSFLAKTEDLQQTVLTPEGHRSAFAGIALERLESIGQLSPGVDLVICNDGGEPAPCREIGKIVTRGGTAISGYWNLPGESTETVREGWVYTGDLGHQDPNGHVYLAGRKKCMIIRGGVNGYPSEVEPVLLEGPRRARRDHHWTTR